MKARALSPLFALSALMFIACGACETATAQLIAPSERAVSPDQLRQAVAEVVARYEARIRAEALRVATQQSALRQSESELRAQVEYFRAQVQSLASDTDPRRQQALADYAAGRQIEAIETLIAIQRAEDASDAFARSEHWKQIAALAFEVNVARAAEALEAALRFAPNDSESWLQLSNALGTLGRREAALEAANSAIRFASTDLARYRAFNVTARSLYMQGRLTEARPYFENARTSLIQLLSRPNVDAHREAIYFGPVYGAYLADSGNLEGARDWLSRFLPIVANDLSNPTLGTEAAFALFTANSLAAVVSARLGYGEEATALAHALTDRMEHLLLGPTPHNTQLLALALSLVGSGAVELRFGDLPRGIGSSQRAAEISASLTTSDPSNTVYSTMRMLALTQVGWGQVLAGQARDAELPLAEAVTIGERIQREYPGEVQSTMLLSQAYVYRGLAAYVSHDRQLGERYMRQGLSISARLSELSHQNPGMRRNIWAQHAVAASFNVGENWDRFVAASRTMVAERIVTPSEFEYMLQVRSDVLARYSIQTSN